MTTSPLPEPRNARSALGAGPHAIDPDLLEGFVPQPRTEPLDMELLRFQGPRPRRYRRR